MDYTVDQLATPCGNECASVQPECYLVAPGGIKIHVIPETGEIVPPGRSPQEVRAWIATLAKAMLGDPSGHRDFPLKHTFLDGMYVREIFIPKGTLLIGRVHKIDCVNIVSSGDISILTEHGSARVYAGYCAPSPAGIQKVGYAHEDTVFVNVFRTDETDLSKVEQIIAYEAPDESFAIEEQSMEKITCQ